MTALSIINMRQSQRYHNELNSGEPLGVLEKIAVRLQLARDLQKQPWDQIALNGRTLEANLLKELLTICNTDPAHIAVLDDMTDYNDLKMTEANARY